VKVLGVDHIGVAIPSRLENLLSFWFTGLGLDSSDPEVIPDQQVETIFLRVGGIAIELISSTSSDGPIAKFLEKRGPGIHHICLQVDDIWGFLQRLKGVGCRLIDETPRRGARDKLVAFIHPSSTGGVLIELCQSPPQ